VHVPREPNAFVDIILETIAAHAGARPLFLTCFDPDICLMLKLKQKRFPGGCGSVCVVLMFVRDARSHAHTHTHTHTHTRAFALLLAHAISCVPDVLWAAESRRLRGPAVRVGVGVCMRALARMCSGQRHDCSCPLARPPPYSLSQTTAAAACQRPLPFRRPTDCWALRPTPPR
jgi:hypothetical protein